MLLNRSLQLTRIVRLTWKVDLLMLFLCILAYYVDTLLLKDLNIPPALPTLMGTAIAFFIGFNNNQAYDRWWEARTIWGELVNNSREWARSMIAYCSVPSGGTTDIVKEYEKYLTTQEAESIKHISNKANAILDIQSRELEKMANEKIVDSFRYYAMANLIKNFGEGMGKSERIANTVFPTVYVYFTRLFSWMFVILLTMSISLRTSMG